MEKEQLRLTTDLVGQRIGSQALPAFSPLTLSVWSTGGFSF